MRAVDVLSLAMAALVGLFTLTLQPWSAQWWCCVAVAAFFAVGAIAHMIFGHISPEVRAQIGPATWTEEGQVRNGRLRAGIALGLLALLIIGFVYSQRISPDFITKLVAAAPLGSFPEVPQSAVPNVQSETFPPNGVMISTEGKGVMRCDIPLPPTPTVQEYAQQFQIYKNQAAGLGDTLGIEINVSPIRDGIKVDYNANTAEGKDLFWRITGAPISKFTFEFRRVGQYVLVTFILDRPWMPQWLMNQRPLGTKDDFIRFERGVEKMFSLPPGVCHVI
ncbi:MAG: hypothetical protein WA268_15935 [Xanthobacteraceae bacterium]